VLEWDCTQTLLAVENLQVQSLTLTRILSLILPCIGEILVFSDMESLMFRILAIVSSVVSTSTFFLSAVWLEQVRYSTNKPYKKNSLESQYNVIFRTSALTAEGIKIRRRLGWSVLFSVVCGVFAILFAAIANA
jgi:hypothetical protein